MSGVKTTIKTDLCSFSEYRIYPGRGQRFVARDGKVHTFIHRKEASLFKQRIKPVKLHWTLVWRRMNKKGGKDAVSKRRTRKSTKTVQKAIVGLSLEDIKRTRAQKPDASKAKTTAAVKDAKEKAKKKPASGTRPPRQTGPAQKVQIPKQQKQATNMQRRK
ncbi:60s ribosomal protein [Cystoisospora suis]|uniref:60s ribosomal protein n=1 Tax=Cystoisospora suis TaxID=483139 RepID=A0A2C6KHY2_9APIC|nr:60s ribosomal protein [Cystoisospora suis]